MVIIIIFCNSYFIASSEEFILLLVKDSKYCDITHIYFSMLQISDLVD